MNATVKRIGTIAAGSVLFFLLGRYVTIPSPIPTVNICVQYGLLAFLAVACGPLTGSMTGLIGHILIDLSGGRMFWSWIIATAAFGGLLGVLAGTDTFDSSSTTTQAYQLLVYNAADPAVNDVHLVLAMREAAHRILYTVANSNAMNENGVIVSTMNWWQFSLIDGIIFSSLAALVFLALTARDVMKSKKKKHNS